MGEINWNVVITIGTIVFSISSAFMIVKNKTEQHEKDLNKLEANIGDEYNEYQAYRVEAKVIADRVI